jgi:hypothetical protein
MAEDEAVSAATILVADDDRAIRTVLNQALGRLGYEVRHTGTAATLWQWSTTARRPRHHRRGDARRERPRPLPRIRKRRRTCASSS